MAKLKRSAHALYVKGGDMKDWYLVGKDIDDMSVELNGTFETTKNILDETSVSDTGYEPSVDVTPYYANPSDSIYSFLLDLALGRKSGDDCKGSYMECVNDGTTIKAWQEDCKFEITSYGGDTNGVNIEFTIHPDGNREEGTATIDASTKQPTFTKASA